MTSTLVPDLSHVPGPGHQHYIALLSLLYLPVAVLLLLVALDTAARAGSSAALQLRSAYLGTTPDVLLASLGMLVSATVHLVLAVTHLSEAPALACLFALDGVALVAAVLWALVRPFGGWRPAGVSLLSAGVLAYAVSVAVGQETLDPVGVATKVVELAAIGLLVIPSRLAAGRWSKPLIPHKRAGGLIR
jgi:hypothetical protein